MSSGTASSSDSSVKRGRVLEHGLAGEVGLNEAKREGAALHLALDGIHDLGRERLELLSHAARRGGRLASLTWHTTTAALPHLRRA